VGVPDGSVRGSRRPTSSTSRADGLPQRQPPVKAGTADEKAAIEAARTIANDGSPYVAIAVRPKLPRWQEQKERTHVIVVDTSRSMVGERFARARRLASTIVKEMDRRDSFVVLACDTTCRGMDGSIAPKPQAPGASGRGRRGEVPGRDRARRRSDLLGGDQRGARGAGSSRDRELRILYLGDGTPTWGRRARRTSRRPCDRRCRRATARSWRWPRRRRDTTSLQAMARGGGGVVVPYVPGQKVSTAALEVLVGGVRRGAARSGDRAARGAHAGDAVAARSDPRGRRVDHRRAHGDRR
jgi:hypothetical protein